MSKDSIGKCGMAAFNVAKKSDDGVKMPLALPDGTPTDEWLTVLGADSKAFRKEKSKANRKRLDFVKKHSKGEDIDVVLMSDFDNDVTLEMIASLVASWSFDEECTTENVISFFRACPQVQEQVDEFAVERANFFETPRQG